MKAEGLSSEGLGSEGSPVSRDSRPPSVRRIKKRSSAAAPKINSTSVTTAAAQPKGSDGDCRNARHNPVSSILAGSHMCERPVPIEGRRAGEDYQDHYGSQKGSKRQLKSPPLAADGNHYEESDAA